MPWTSLNPVVLCLSVFRDRRTLDVNIGRDHAVLDVGVEEGARQLQGDVGGQPLHEERIQLAVVVHTRSHDRGGLPILNVLHDLGAERVGGVRGRLHGVLADRVSARGDVPGVRQLEVLRQGQVDLEPEPADVV